LELPALFGRYHLLERLAVGGMAEIYLAKSFGAAGFERLLVIKKILPHLTADNEFITGFIDAVRMASTLNHSNVAQINELDKEGGAYFIAMEFVHGKDLSRIYDRSVQTKRGIPIPLAVLIASRICEGLDYAHRRTDSAGRNLNIVHRDLSPGNILVSYAGDVKLIDFGIAKSIKRMGRATAGTLKSKFGYMAPEQVRGLSLDRRSDIFTVGILLYEMLTGESLFGGESDFVTLEKVRNAIVTPPTTYNSKIPKQLEKTILRALAEDPEKRYEWVSDLQADLVRFLMHTGSPITGKSLASFVRDLFSKDIAKENERLAVYRRRGYPWVDEARSKKDRAEAEEASEEEEYSDGANVEHVGAQPSVILSDNGVANLPAGYPVGKRAGTDACRRVVGDTEAVRGKRAYEAARKKRLIGTVAAFCLGLFVAVLAAYFLFAPRGEKEPIRSPAESAPLQETAPEEKPLPKVAAAKPIEKELSPFPQPVEKVSPATRRTSEATPKTSPKWKTKKKVSPKTASREPKGGSSIRVKSTPPGAEILLNGKKIGKTPTTVGGLNPQKNYFVVLKKAGYKPFFHGVKFKGNKCVVIDATLEPGRFAASKKGDAKPSKSGGEGFLIVNTKPRARVIIDGKDTGRWTPLVGQRKLSLPAGSHKITLKTKAGRTLTVNVTIQAGKTTKVIEQIH
jgi:serine/threonine protein kinase